MIKNIIFDLGGVLLYLDSQRCIRGFDKIGAHHVSEYVRDHRTEDLFLGIEIGQMTTKEFCDEVRHMAGNLPSDNDIIWAWNQLLVDIPDDKKQRLLDLKADYRLFLLSNTNEMHWNKCAEDFFPYKGYSVQDYFEHVYLSYKMNMAKPSPEIFQAVLQHSQLDASETLFIDDSLVNCQSAASLGIQALHETTGTDWMNTL